MKNSVLKLKSYKNKNKTRKNRVIFWKDIDPPKRTLKNYKKK